jgi:hypothetical protein
MEISGTGGAEDRIAALEKRIRGMDALVKGLLDELLDFKAIAMTMSRRAGDSCPPDLSSLVMESDTISPSITAPLDERTTIQVNSIHPPDVPVAPKEPAMVRIMQADGTMKMEPRYGDKTSTDSSRGFRRAGKSTAGKSTQNSLISAAE